MSYQPAQARKSLAPSCGVFLQKLNKYVYIITVGSATPKINKGWPPNIEWIIPQMAVDANVSTVLKLPSVKACRIEKLAYRMNIELTRNKISSCKSLKVSMI